MSKAASGALILLLIAAASGFSYLWSSSKLQNMEALNVQPLTQPAAQSVASSTEPSSLSIEPRDASIEVYDDVGDITFEFIVHNISNKPVRILQIKPDCGCTDVKISATHLPPNEQARLKAVYDVKGKFGELPRHKILLLTDDPESPQVICTIGGFRRRRFIVTPPTVDFKTILGDQTPKQQVTIEVSGADSSLVLEQMMTSHSAIRSRIIDIQPMGDKGSRLTLEVGLEPKLPQGRIDGKVFIPHVQNDGIGPVIHVSADVVGPLKLDPQQAFMGIMDKTDIVKRTVQVLPGREPTAGELRTAIQIIGFDQAPLGVHLEADSSNKNIIHITAIAAELGSGNFHHDVAVKCLMDGKPKEIILSITGKIRN